MSKKDTSNFFDSYAQDFNAIYGTKNTFMNRIINNLFRKSMKIRFDKTIAGCYPIEGKTVIDIGCGPGHYSITLARRGAKRVLGIDFAQTMIELAEENAEHFGVADRCDFIQADFASYPIRDKFDYAIVIGFMEYVRDPKEIVDKVLAITKQKAFFSFPKDKGFLAWQRRLRYKRKCDLFLYNQKQLHQLFAAENYEIEKIGRDYFVTVRSVGVRE